MVVKSLKHTDALAIYLLSISMVYISVKANAQQNFGVRTSRPYGVKARALAINLSAHIFAGTSEGIYRSTDNGDSWQEPGLSINAVNQGTGTLAIDSTRNEEKEVSPKCHSTNSLYVPEDESFKIESVLQML
ncbi:MAG: hypothetical protein ACPL4I_01670 [Bacteroidota bacterium]